MSLARQVSAHTDALAGLVNDAGVYEGHDLKQTTEEEWERVLAVHLRAPFFLIRSLSPALRAASGAAVHIASILALRSSAGTYPYWAAKAGLVQIARGLALEMSPEVRGNAVAPGFTRTTSTGVAGKTRRFTGRLRPRLRWGGGESRKTRPLPSCSCSRTPPAASRVRCWP